MDDPLVVINDRDPDSLGGLADPIYEAAAAANNTTRHANNTPPGRHTHGSVHNVVWIYIAPVILLVGLIGNVLIMCVMRRPQLRGSSATVYLPVMAFFDTLVLITGIIPEWLEAMDITIIKETHPASCKMEKFLFYSTSDTAIWLLVLFTFDRFIAVCFPLRKMNVCRPRKAVLFSVVAFVASCAKNVHVFWTRGYEAHLEGGLLRATNCGKPNSFHFESYVRPWIAFVAVSVIPFLAILTFNVGIVRKLIRTRPVGSSPSPRRGRVERQFSQATIMCLSASFMFLLTITPSIVLLIGKPYWTKRDLDHVYNHKYGAAKAISNVMVYLNHSLTFFLYCLTGRRFREELCHMLRGRLLPQYSSCKSQLTTATSAGLNYIDPLVLQRSNSFASVYQVNVVLDKKRTSGTSTNSMLYQNTCGGGGTTPNIKAGSAGLLVVNGGARRSISNASNV